MLFRSDLHRLEPNANLLEQAKSGYKTRKKRNPNKYVVQERVRNQGKRKRDN